MERRLGLPVTPMCDRFTSSISKIQTGFFRFIAAPLFEEWHRFHATPLSKTMLSFLRSNKVFFHPLVLFSSFPHLLQFFVFCFSVFQLKWDAILSKEESGESSDSGTPEWQPNESFWPELGVLETSAERIHLRRASLPADRSGLWTLNFANHSKLMHAAQSGSVEDDATFARETTPLEFSVPLRSQLSSDEQHNTHPYEDRTSSFSTLYKATELFADVPLRLHQRRESLPSDLPGRSQTECCLRLGRRESLPADCSRVVNVNEVLPELNITSITPFRSSCRREKRASISSFFQPATSIPSSPPLGDFGSTADKENVDITSGFKAVSSFMLYFVYHVWFCTHVLGWSIFNFL